jgi:hypothetical protein
MYPDPKQPDPPKKPVTKNWKSQVKRTADSVKKLKKGVDELKPWAWKPWAKEPHRTDVPYRILPILLGLKRRSMPREAIVHSLTSVLFEEAFKPAPGSSVNLEDVWQKIIARLQRMRPDVVEWLSHTEHKNAFLWQIAGHVEEYSRPVRKVLRQVYIFKITKGPRKGQRLQIAELQDGSRVELPKDWQPDWPQFFSVGAYWQGEPVCNCVVANMAFSWPCPSVEQIWSSILWEPPMRIFTRKKKK